MTHLICRDVPEQGVHVFVAGSCGFALTLLPVVSRGAGAEGLLLPACLAVAAAIGRAWAIRSVPGHTVCRGPR